jgi:phospholipid transport system substrate-binding protein
MRRLLVLTIVALLQLAGAGAEAAPGARDAVGAFETELLAIMRDATALGPAGRFHKLEPVIRQNFDLPFMTKLSIGVSWGRLTPDQKQRAAAAFGRYITAVYAGRFDGYSGERFETLDERKIAHGVLVRTQLVKPSGETVSINFVLHDNDTAWQIRDIYLSGTISEIATRRSEFSAILRDRGIEGLITMLNQKADTLA